METLLEMFMPEQVDQLLKVMRAAQRESEESHFEQMFYIAFSSNGYPIKFGRTTDQRPIRPVETGMSKRPKSELKYKAE